MDVRVYTCGCFGAIEHVWQSEDNRGRELVFSTHHVNVGDRIQVVRPGARHLYQ